MISIIRKCFKNINFRIGFCIVVLLTILMIVSCFFTPYDPNEMNTLESFRYPSFRHLLGTDNFGRDIFSRVLRGSQVSFFVGIFAVAVGFAVGFLLGALAGYFGGAADEIIMRLMDAQMAFPGVILALVLIAIFGTGLTNIALALGIMSVPRFCRITRAGFMQIKEMDYVKAAKARGVTSFRLIFFHILPNMVSSLVVTAALGFSGAVLSEAGLSYLGLGIQPPDPSWGKMLYEAQAFLLTQSWYGFIPGTMLTLMVLGFNLLGDGLRDITDNIQER